MGGLQDLIQLLSTKEFQQDFSLKQVTAHCPCRVHLPARRALFTQAVVTLHPLSVCTYTLPPLGEEPLSFSEGLFTKSWIVTNSESSPL